MRPPNCKCSTHRTCRIRLTDPDVTLMEDILCITGGRCGAYPPRGSNRYGNLGRAA